MALEITKAEPKVQIGQDSIIVTNEAGHDMCVNWQVGQLRYNEYLIPYKFGLVETLAEHKLRFDVPGEARDLALILRKIMWEKVSESKVPWSSQEQALKALRRITIY